ncbi:DUF262 domain-containing protein [Priestia aryabhattai]|uniref:DUF262 domain-containing protein n=1 Tax=Priestia aryabhattai TaxID=412384 RepID=UPI002E225B3E|nr:DUF262 domain-containing protein [Priestia aryabhattai]
MIDKNWSVQSTSDSKNLKTIVDEIDSALTGGAGIKLDPEYQREYKFTNDDESLLIESLLMDIPIPVIYLSSDIRKQPYVANVIDGQHRLRAIYRFINNQFTLKDLKFYPSLNNSTFEDLDTDVQNKLLYQSRLHFENIHVQNNPEIEIEIFKRYNKGTHPLSKQELRNAIYLSEFNLWLNDTIKYYFMEDTVKRDIYNISKKRYSDKSAHESIYIMLYILNNGLNASLSTSPEYADDFMSNAAKSVNQEELITSTKEILSNMNMFLEEIYLKLGIKHPFSKELYGVDSRNFKLQTPILMIVSAFIHYLNEQRVDILEEQNFSRIISVLQQGLADSYLEKGFKGSNTRPSILKHTLEDLISRFNH